MSLDSIFSVIGGIVGGQNYVQTGYFPPYVTSSCDKWTILWSSSGSVLLENTYLFTTSGSKKL